MAQKTYHDKNCDLDVLFAECEAWFSQRNYKIQSHKSQGDWLVQATQAETWRVATGSSRAFNVRIQGQPNEFSVDLSTGAWATNLAAGGVAAVLTGGATLLISGVTVGWSKKIEGDITAFIEQRITFGTKAKSSYEQQIGRSQQVLQEKLRQLKEAHDNGFITDAAYQAKKLDIQSQTSAAVETTAAQQQLDRLQALFDQGILNYEEFEAKKREVTQDTVSERDALTARLSAAFAAGILTQQEYETKKAEIDKLLGQAAKLKQLEQARDAGILSDDEFETKKRALGV